MKRLLDLERFPLDRLKSAAGQDLVARCRRDLAARGMFNLEGLVRPEALERCVAEVKPLLDTPDHAAAKAWVEEKVKAEENFEPYTFSKMCTIVYTLTRGVSLPRERGVRINCVSPGPTDTPMMKHFVEQTSQDFMDAFPKPLGRNSTAEEQAWVLAFLCSDAAGTMNGENVFTDGGFAGGLWTGAIDPSALMPPQS